MGVVPVHTAAGAVCIVMSGTCGCSGICSACRERGDIRMQFV